MADKDVVPVHAIFDYDAIIYQAGFGCETRNVEVTNKKNGKKKIFKNQSEFFGRKKDTIEGWLGEQNEILLANGKEPLAKSDFELETIRTVDSLPNTLHTTKVIINGILEKIGAESYVGFIGKGDSFRLDRSTIYKYKGDRDNALKPLLKDEITEYIVKHHNGIVVEGLEADDHVIIEAVQHENGVVVGVDKDSNGCPVKVFNPNKPERGILDCDCFGELSLVLKGTKGKEYKEVEGFGRKFFYYQVAYGDDVDCYRANSASELDWGVVSAYESLANATTDKECLEALVKVYKHLYPEPKVITGWRGDEIQIDWLYVLEENWDLARMLRSEDDLVTAPQVLKKFKLLEN